MSAVFTTIGNVIAPILLIIVLAMLYGRRFQPNPRVLSSLIVYMFTPFLVLQGILDADINSEILNVSLLTIMVAAGIALITLGLTHALGLDQRVQSAFMLSAIAMNAANYGITFNVFAFGEVARPYAVIYYVTSVVVSNTLGVFLASRGSVSGRQAMLNVFTIPLIYASLIGLVLNLGDIELPLALTRTIGILANGAIPAMLVVLGLQLSQASIRGKLPLIFAASGMRLIIGPLLAIVFVSLLGLTGLARQVGILQSAMPTAVLASVLATEFGGDAEFVTTTVLCSTLCSAITLSVLFALIT